MEMNVPRRRFLSLAAGAAALTITLRNTRAEGFPMRPMHIIIAFPPGGVAEIIARLLGQSLQERLGQPIVLENRPGAGGNIGTEAVVRAAGDGYTLIWAGNNNAINATLYTNLKFNFIRDIAMVATVMRGPLVMAVHPSVPAKTVTEFIAYARANPGKVNLASSGIGATGHLSGELFKMATGVEMVHVPYRGEGPALGDLVAGQVQVMFANLPSSIGHIREGRLRALAVTSMTRSPALPDVDTVADVIPDFEAIAWFGVGAPKATPAEVIAKLNEQINASLSEPKLAARFAELGATPMLLSPADADAFVAAETEKWAKAVKFAGAKVD
jgi:tripartite-type tricarboxylate transporter receptor subunit TctC